MRCSHLEGSGNGGFPPCSWLHLMVESGSGRERSSVSLPSHNSGEMLVLHVAEGMATRLRKDKGGIDSNIINSARVSSFSPRRKDCILSLRPRPSPSPARQMWGTIYSHNDGGLHLVGEKHFSSFLAVKWGKTDIF